MSPVAQAVRRLRRRRGVVVLLVGAALVAAVAPTVYARALAAPSNTAEPSVSVPPTVGDTLTATQGSWSNSPTTFAFQWLKCPASGGAPDGSDCTAVTGATTNAYTVASGDVGGRFRARVTATNGDGSASAASDATVAAVGGPAPPTGCPLDKSTTPIRVDQVSLPGQLRIDGQQIIPSPVVRTTQTIRVRIHVSACGGRSVGGALVYGEPTPYQQFAPTEQPTQNDGWATLTMTRLRFFPVSSRQQILVVFARARKPGEDILGGISARRLISFPVSL